MTTTHHRHHYGPPTFYCDTCERWTNVEEDRYSAAQFWCTTCGSEYHCQECGYDIDRAGYCQRDDCGEHEEES